MKVTGLFLEQDRIGTYFDGVAYINGAPVKMEPCFHLKDIEVKELEVYERTSKWKLSKYSTVMEVVKKDGCLAVVKNKMDQEQAAVLRYTSTVNNGEIIVLGVAIGDCDAKLPESCKKRWIIME